MLFDSHPGPNYTFIIENSSQLFSDKMFLATGQQLIAVIKPSFDFICSDSTKHDRHGSDRQSGLSPSYSMRGMKLLSVFTELSLARRGFMKPLGAITHPFHMHYQ